MDEFLLFCSAGVPSYVLIPSLLVLVAVILFGIYSKRVYKKISFILWTFLVEYVFIVICSTVVCRSYLPQARLELMPFWDYVAIINHTPGVSIWDIILNIVLFVPLGFLISALFPKMKWWNVVFGGLLFSLTIELLQFMFSKGIGQTDDMMHNSFGTFVGYVILHAFVGISKRLKTKNI